MAIEIGKISFLKLPKINKKYVINIKVNSQDFHIFHTYL